MINLLQIINGNILNFSQLFLYSNNAKCKQQLKTTTKIAHLSDISIIYFSLERKMETYPASLKPDNKLKPLNNKLH